VKVVKKVFEPVCSKASVLRTAEYLDPVAGRQNEGLLATEVILQPGKSFGYAVFREVKAFPHLYRSSPVIKANEYQLHSQ